MLQWLSAGLVWAGAALMVYNIYGFIRFAMMNQSSDDLKQRDCVFYIPIVLLILFLLGYLSVGFFGKPDLIMGGILFGGSVFVFIMYKLLGSITERILQHEQLKAQLLAAEESNRTKTSFLASVSHEMRTPLNVILGQDRIALRNPDLPEETRGHLEKIGLSARHLLGMINDILDMNEIGADSLELKYEEYSLLDALAQVNSIAQTLSEEKGLTYVSDVPGSAEGRYLGDVMQLKRVMLSLLDNAVRYTDAPGTVRCSVQIVSEEDDKRVFRFSVSDTGIGMDPEFLSQLFESFSREDASSTSRHGGTGMSLAVAKRLLEMRGGSITVESEKNVGSTFIVTLPIPYAGPAQVPSVQSESPVSLEGCRILLAEDILDNAEIVMDLLELEGAETTHAENGRIALDMFHSAEINTFDAILMDLRMPEMDGLEAARQIRALKRPDARTVPIIALTANAFESDVRATLDAGMNAHLAKPVDADQLYDTLRRQISGAHKHEGS